ncbi:MAG: acyl-CoA dehydrogenase, partial [Thalassobaculaceae bacterium]
MSHSAELLAAHDGAEAPLLGSLLPKCRAAADQVTAYAAAARAALNARVAPAGKPRAELLEAEQHAAHGYAWIATYDAALKQMLGWAEGLEAAGALSELDALLLQLGFAEYLNQLAGGLPMSQSEMVRPSDLDLAAAAAQHLT